MSSLNKVMIIGNVGKDIEVRHFPSGEAVCNVSIATSESWKDKSTGERKEKTEWHNVSFFGKLAEIVGEYVVKGDKLYVEGSLQTRQYEKDGVTRYTTEIKARDMVMLGGKRDSTTTTGPEVTNEPEFDQDIPF